MATGFQAGAFQTNAFQAGQQYYAAGSFGVTSGQTSATTAPQNAAVAQGTTQTVTAAGRRAASAASTMAARSGLLGTSGMTRPAGSSLGSTGGLQITAIHRTEVAVSVPSVLAGVLPSGKTADHAASALAAKGAVSSPGNIKTKATVPPFGVKETELSSVPGVLPTIMAGVFGVSASHLPGTFKNAFQLSSFQLDAFQTQVTPLTYVTGSIKVIERSVNPVSVIVGENNAVLKDMFSATIGFGVHATALSPGHQTTYAPLQMFVTMASFISTGTHVAEAGAAIGSEVSGLIAVGHEVRHAASAFIVADTAFIGPVYDNETNHVTIAVRLSLVNAASVTRRADGLIEAVPKVAGVGSTKDHAAGTITTHAAVLGVGRGTVHATEPAFGVVETLTSHQRQSVSAVQQFHAVGGLSEVHRAIRKAQQQLGVRGAVTQVDASQGDRVSFSIGVAAAVAPTGRRTTAATVPLFGAKGAVAGRGTRSTSAAVTEATRAGVAASDQLTSRAQATEAVKTGSGMSGSSVRRALAAVAKKIGLGGLGTYPQHANVSLGVGIKASSPGSATQQGRGQAGVTAREQVASRVTGQGPAMVGAKAGQQPGTVRVVGVGPAHIVAGARVSPTNKTGVHVHETMGVAPRVAGVGNLSTLMHALLSTALLKVAGDGLRRLLFGPPDKIIRGVLTRSRTLQTNQMRVRELRRADDQAPPRVRTLKRVKEE